MKRIGIITFHRAENYGAFLQTYASQINLMNIFPNTEVKVIDYQPWYFKNTYRLRVFDHYNNIRYSLRSGLVNLYFFPSRLKKKLKFKLSLKYLNLTSKYNCRSWKERFDILYLGSDQIWNTKITKGVDPVFYGEISGGSFSKIAYAASLGEEPTDKRIVNEMRSKLENIQCISVREKSTIEYLEKLTHLKCEFVLDPTLLVKEGVWKKVSRQTIKEKNYVLIYTVNDGRSMYKDACEFAQKKGCSVISLNEVGKKNSLFFGVPVKSYVSLSPFEFVGAIQNAKAVFTDSFHGTCFSIIFQRDFFTYLSLKRNSRIVDLCDSLGLTNRLIPYLGCVDNEEKFKNINYHKVKEELKVMQDKSQNYLLNCLGGDKRE